MIIIGADPGLKGGLVVLLHFEQKLEILGWLTMPITSTEEVDADTIGGWVRTHSTNYGHLDAIVVEKTLALPGQAVKAAFSQGYNLAMLHAGIQCAGQRFEEVAPITWTTWLHRHAPRTKDSKADTWASLQAILGPQEIAKIPRGPRSGKPHEGIVDALGIAVWRAKGYQAKGVKR